MHPTHDDLVLHYYGESGDETAGLNLHLATCADCRAAMHRLEQALALLGASGEGEPSPGYEATMWARLQPALTAPLPWWRRPWRTGAARWVVATSMAAMAGIAFYAGWQMRGASTVTHPADGRAAAAAAAARAGGPGPAADAPVPDPVRSRLLDLAVGDHLVRAHLVLTEVANGEVADNEPLAADRQRASDLVATNRLVRQTAALAGDELLDRVLDDLERTLVEIANAPDDLTADDWAAFRARVDTQGLLFRVRVLSDELRQRQQPATLRKGPTS